MRSTSTLVATFQNTRVCHGAIRCVGRPSRLHDRELVGLGLDRLEQLRGEIRPRRLEHGETLGREFGAHDIVQLDGELAPRVEQRVAARLEHALEPAVAHEEGALAVLHRHAQTNRCRVMAHLLHWPSQMATAGCISRKVRSRTRASRAIGGPRLEPA